jgi:hypothetical protein
MATYKNDYSQKSDFTLWLLHEIRSKMAKQGINAEELNNQAKEILKKYQLSNLKIKPV